MITSPFVSVQTKQVFKIYSTVSQGNGFAVNRLNKPDAIMATMRNVEDWYIGNAQVVDFTGSDDELNIAIVQASNDISTVSRRGKGNIVMMNTAVARRLATIEFAKTDDWAQAGKINDLDLWVSDIFPEDKIVVAYRGSPTDACTTILNQDGYWVFKPQSEFDHLVQVIALS